MGERLYYYHNLDETPPPFDLLDQDGDDVLGNTITPAELGGAQGDATLATQTLYRPMQERLI